MIRQGFYMTAQMTAVIHLITGALQTFT